MWVKVIARIKSLQSLCFSSTVVIDAGLKDLAEPRNLHTLYLGPRMTDAGVAELQNALPKCKISR